MKYSGLVKHLPIKAWNMHVYLQIVVSDPVPVPFLANPNRNITDLQNSNAYRYRGTVPYLIPPPTLSFFKEHTGIQFAYKWWRTCCWILKQAENAAAVCISLKQFFAAFFMSYPPTPLQPTSITYNIIKYIDCNRVWIDVGKIENVTHVFTKGRSIVLNKGGFKDFPLQSEWV